MFYLLRLPQGTAICLQQTDSLVPKWTEFIVANWQTGGFPMGFFPWGFSQGVFSQGVFPIAFDSVAMVLQTLL